MSLLSQPEPVAAVLERPHSLLEGPRIAGDGSLVYSDVIAGGLWACSEQGLVTELLHGRRGIGGIVGHADGGWVISGRSLLHLAADGAQRELLSDPEVPGYNDISSTPGGELLAGELRYRPMSGEPPREGRLLAVSAAGGARTITDRVLWPNGIGVAPDGITVYVSDYARRRVLACPLWGGEPEELAESPRGSADGLAVDAEGGIWVALGEGGAVARFEPDGLLDEIVEVPAGFVSSISFGGPDMCDVLISTADNRVSPELGGTLLRARSEVAGLPIAAVSV
ncbi:MAG: SMP-30/gluconolactonase/LRE family protein [Solirubrobacteraceae bacterium]